MRRIDRALASALLGGLALAAASAGAGEREVLVLRGRGGPPPATAPQAAAPVLPLALAGERLWLVDRERSTLLACRLERTTRVGERRIRCAERRLPAAGG